MTILTGMTRRRVFRGILIVLVLAAGACWCLPASAGDAKQAPAAVADAVPAATYDDSQPGADDPKTKAGYAAYMAVRLQGRIHVLLTGDDAGKERVVGMALRRLHETVVGQCRRHSEHVVRAVVAADADGTGQA